MDKVGHARSTYRKAREFQQGIEALSETTPLASARAYLLTGNPQQGCDVHDYARIDKLQSVRKSAIQAESRHVDAQVRIRGKKNPMLVRRVAEQEGFFDEEIEELVRKAEEGILTGEELFGVAVMSGDDIRFGFGSEALELAPSLEIYELVMWTTLGELTDLV